MAKKGKTILVKLESTAGTGFYYVTTRNTQNTPDKFEFKKYDPVVRKHVIFKEKKIK
jgi:large subunit ribosomal protein L33